MASTCNGFHALKLVGVVVSTMVAAPAAKLYQDFDLTWGDNRAKIFNGGQLVSLSLYIVSGYGFQSKKEYLFGRIDMQLNLFAGNSAGTVTAYYMNSNSEQSIVNLKEDTDVFVGGSDGADGLSSDDLNDDIGGDGQQSDGCSSDEECDDQQSDGGSSDEYSDCGLGDECSDGGSDNDIRNVGEENDIDGDNVDGHENDGGMRKKVDDTYKRITELTKEDICELDFGSEIEAIEFYSTYAKLHGFMIRKKNVRRDCKGNVVMRQLVCNREGLRDKKHFTRVDRVREHKPLTRTDCRAQFRVHFDYKTCRWVVGGFVEGHNHELTPSSFVHLIPGYRHMTDADKSQVESLNLYGVRTCHIMGLMVGQKGGYSDLGFCKKDVYNHLDRKRRAKIQDGDAFAALSYLQGKADSDPSLFVKFTTTSDGRLQHMFWCDGPSRVDFECFGDVLAFDATYKKNKYNKPLVIFSGTNHHGKTTIFACALVDDETVETYKWVLKTLLEAMLKKHPSAVVTDGDNAMRKAIKAIFPNARHRLCSWHLQNNACENVKNAEFLEDFSRAMYSNFTVAQFEDFWERMIEKHNVCSRKAKKWIKKTYKRKRMWATAYLREEFFGRIRTTSRCEGINSFIKQHVRNKNSLVDFFRGFDRVLNDYRNNEHEADYKSLYGGEPVMTTSLKNIELGASKIYTPNIFAEVKVEIEQAGALIVLNITQDGNTVKYRMNKFCSPVTVSEVTYDRAQSKFVCDCRGFESRGIPCSHIFCAMKHEHMDSIPRSLILKRWTKIAKSDYTPSIQMEDNDSEMGFKMRFGALAAICNRLCKIAARKLDDFTEVKGEIRKLIMKLETRNDRNRNREGNQKVVGDPMMVKTKGDPSKKKNWRKRKYKCSHCHKSGHNIAKCPKMITNKAECSNKEDSSSSEYDIDSREDNDEELPDSMYMSHNGALQTSQWKDNSGEMASATAFRKNRIKPPCSTQDSVKENVKQQKVGVSLSTPVQNDAPPIDLLHNVVNDHKTTENDIIVCHSMISVPIEACRPALEIATTEGLPYVYKSFPHGMPVCPQYPEPRIPVQGMATFTQYPGQGMAAYPQYSEQGVAFFTQFPGVQLYPHIPAVPIYPQNPATGLWNQYYGCTQDADGANVWPGVRPESSAPHK